MSLSVSQLACARGGFRLFEPITLTLEPGQALILRGPNGAGKTTLLRTLAGLMPPETGTATLDGVPVARADGTIAYSGHLDAVKSTLTVAENLEFWSGYHGHGDLDAVLAEFDLTTLTDRPAARLSAGQRRRLGLARMALTGATLWLLDEPTVSLDTASANALTARVARHVQGGGIAILATHIPLNLTAGTLELTPARQVRSLDPFLESTPA